ncbi:MAG: GNAT family acetyltransferase [Leptospiraceae bacterium]|nr:GNAT family acetyltransferase [Leptospiraceae bacterium]
MNFQIRTYEDRDELELVSLLQNILPSNSYHNDPIVSIRNKVKVDKDLLLVALIDNKIVGTIMGGYDGHRGWIYSLAVSINHRSIGIGKGLVHSIELKLKQLGCLKINLQVVESNKTVISFYQKLGFEIEERISMGKKIYS